LEHLLSKLLLALNTWPLSKNDVVACLGVILAGVWYRPPYALKFFCFIFTHLLAEEPVMTEDSNHSNNQNYKSHHHTLNAAFWLTAIFMCAELLGGYISNSLSLMADAGHMASDVMALGLAMVAQQIAARPANTSMTYGYGRAKVLAAQINGLTLWFLSGWIVWEAIGRLNQPPEVNGLVVLIIASLGLVINLIIMRWLHGSDDLNTQAVYWHVLGDALGSIAAIIAGLVILLTGWMPIDPILSFLVAGILAWGGWRLVKATTLELMEAVPQDADYDAILEAINQVEGVESAHHIHLWKLPTGKLALSAHIKLHHMNDWVDLLPLLINKLTSCGVHHSTLQPEARCPDNDFASNTTEES